jgi:hypothetical protein
MPRYAMQQFSIYQSSDTRIYLLQNQNSYPIQSPQKTENKAFRTRACSSYRSTLSDWLKKKEYKDEEPLRGYGTTSEPKLSIQTKTVDVLITIKCDLQSTDLHHQITLRFRPQSSKTSPVTTQKPQKIKPPHKSNIPAG